VVRLQASVLSLLLTRLSQFQLFASKLLSVFVVFSAYSSQLSVKIGVVPLRSVCGLIKLASKLDGLFTVLRLVLLELITERFVLGTKRINLLTKLVVLAAQGVLLVLQLLTSLEGYSKLISHIVPLGVQAFLLDFENGSFAIGAVELRSEGCYLRVQAYTLLGSSCNIRLK
jgi:hypothetical protein